MKTRRIAIILTALILIGSCSPAKQEDQSQSPNSGIRVIKEYYPDGRIKSTIEASGKLRHGVSKDYRNDGSLENLINYQNNLKHGPAYTYYPDGKTVKIEMEYVEGRKHGEANWYYQSGKLYRKTLYLNGLIEGIRSTYYESGSIQSELTYQSGKPGMNLKEYNVNGSPRIFNPTIVFIEKDRISLDNTFILQISLSDGSQNVTWYMGKLTNGQYWNDKLSPLSTDNGIGTMEFHVSKGTFKMETINVVARVKTSFNNYHILQREYHLALENKF